MIEGKKCHVIKESHWDNEWSGGPWSPTPGTDMAGLGQFSDNVN